MKLIDRLLKIYSMCFLGLLCLFFLGIGILAAITGNPVQFSQLPWSGGALTNWILLLSLAGLAAVALAGAGKLRWLLALFAVYVLAQMLWGFYIGPHRFDGIDDFQSSLGMSMAALVAAFGAVRAAIARA